MIRKFFDKLWQVIMVRKTRLRNKPFFLTFSLFVMLLIFPIIQGKYANQLDDPADLVLCILFSLIMFSSIMVVWRHSLMSLLIIVLGIPWIILHWLEYTKMIHFDGMTHLEAGMLIIFSVAMFTLIMSHILSTETVTASTILNAVSAYLFIGIIWAALYVLMLLHDGKALHTSFDIGKMNFSDLWDTCIYYSFTTMTTVGFGDITPASPVAKSLSVVEAVAGPLFLAIMIARLVGLYRKTKQVHEIEAYVEQQEGRNDDKTADS